MPLRSSVIREEALESVNMRKSHPTCKVSITECQSSQLLSSARIDACAPGASANDSNPLDRLVKHCQSEMTLNPNFIRYSKIVSLSQITMPMLLCHAHAVTDVFFPASCLPYGSARLTFHFLRLLYCLHEVGLPINGVLSFAIVRCWELASLCRMTTGEVRGAPLPDATNLACSSSRNSCSD